MWLKLVILIICQVISHGSLANGQVQLTIQSIPKFPFYSDTLFNIRIIPTPPINNKLINFEWDTMVVRITDKTNTEVEKTMFVYGMKSEEYQQFRGDFIKIPLWKKDIFNHDISLNVIFTKQANKKFIEIYQLSTNSKDTYKKMMKNLTLAKLLYKSEILLWFPPKLDLFLKSIDEKKNGFYPDQIGIAVCRSYGGVPLKKPNFTNSNNFNVKSSNYIKEKNEIELKIKISRFDHLEKLQCQAGKITADIQIKVIHPPSNVNLAPNADNTFEISNSILCRPGNGYPLPSTSWNFVSGPVNSSLFYTISGNNRRLNFMENTPQKSRWLFNCSATNNAVNAAGIFNQTIKFVIKEGNLISMFDFEKMKTGNVSQTVILKQYINQQIAELKKFLNKIDNDNQKLKLNGIKLSKEIPEIKKQLLKAINDTKNYNTKKDNEILQLKDRMKDQDSKIENLNDNVMKRLDDPEKSTNENNILKQDVVKQNDAISGLKIQIETLKTDSENSKNNLAQTDKSIKLLALSNEVIQSQLKFVKQNLYWIVPIIWTVSDISVENSDKKEAISDSFYSPIKNYKMNLYTTFTKESIQFYIYLPVSSRNTANGWPFRCQITITVMHKSFPSINKTRTIISSIYSHPSISNPVTFSHRELSQSGYLTDDLIKILCDVKEL